MNDAKKIREIALDTETTGLDANAGDRIVDIGCVELINGIRTGQEFQVYINPGMIMSQEAVDITGITNEFLADKPRFADIADDFLEFIKDGTLVIHNAEFDVAFLNMELEKVGKPTIELSEVVDTLQIARKKFPGAPLSLDSLCRRFDIDLSVRSKHGALVDAQLLADVYINLQGGLQGGLSFETEHHEIKTEGNAKKFSYVRTKHAERHFPVSDEELNIHAEFLQKLNNPLWDQFYGDLK